MVKTNPFVCKKCEFIWDTVCGWFESDLLWKEKYSEKRQEFLRRNSSVIATLSEDGFWEHTREYVLKEIKENPWLLFLRKD